MSAKQTNNKTLSEKLGLSYNSLYNDIIHIVIQRGGLGLLPGNGEVYVVVQRSIDMLSAPWYDLVIAKIVNTDISAHKRCRMTGYRTLSNFYKCTDVEVSYGILTSIVKNQREFVNIHPSRILIRDRITTLNMSVVENK